VYRSLIPALLGLVLIAGCRGSSRPDAVQERAAVELEKLGARVLQDEDSPGKPVVKVDFTGSSVKDDDLAQLRKFPKVRSVDLTGTDISDAGLAHLKEMPQLESVRLFRTRVTPTGIKQLQEAIPGLTVVE
jgi:hypothetical protein